MRHAHGYFVQTLADLGILGLGVSLALLAAWLAAAARTTGARRRRRGAPETPERIGLLTLSPSSSSSACTRWSTGRGSSRATSCRRCCSPAGSPAADPTRCRLRARAACARACAAGRDRGGADRRRRRRDRAAWPTLAARSAPVAEALDALGTRRGARPRPGAPSSRGARRPQPAVARAAVRARRRSSAPPATPRGARSRLRAGGQAQPASADAWVRLAELRAQRGPQRRRYRSVGPALYLDPRSQRGGRSTSRPTARPAEAAEAACRPTGAGAQRAARARAARAGRSAGRVDLDRAKPASPSTARSVRAREEAQVIGARVEVRVGGRRAARAEPRRWRRPAACRPSAARAAPRPAGRRRRRRARASRPPTRRRTRPRRTAAPRPPELHGLARPARARGAPQRLARPRRPPSPRSRRRSARPRRRRRRSRGRARGRPAATCVEQERAARLEALGLGALGDGAPDRLSPVLHRASEATRVPCR